MAYRTTYSRVENSPQARAENSLDIAVIINGFRMGRIQSLSLSGQASPRPATELGSDRAIEYVPGIKMFSARCQSMTLRYGDLIKRLASLSGAYIDQDSIAATLTNFPEFDIVIARRGSAGEPAPSRYAPSLPTQDLSGSGGAIKILQGCVIETFDQNFQSQETLIMENVSIKYIDQTTPEANIITL